MNSAEKFELFLKICKWIFITLLILNLTIISISWWIIFLSFIIPIVIVIIVLSKNAG